MQTLKRQTSFFTLLCVVCGALNRVPSHRLGEEVVCGRCKERFKAEYVPHVTPLELRRLAEAVNMPLVINVSGPGLAHSSPSALIFEDVALRFTGIYQFVGTTLESGGTVGGISRITTVPTILLLERKREVARLSGVATADDVDQWLRLQRSPRKAA